MKNILVIRLSAMGDVILSLPVIRSVLFLNPDLTITVLTREPFHSFFLNIERLHVVTAKVKNEHKSAAGLIRLKKELTTQRSYDAVIDLHDVLRSRLLSFLFRISGTPIYRIKKDRASKKKIIKTKVTTSLPHTSIRYLEVFEAAGLKTDFSNALKTKPGINVSEADLLMAEKFSTNVPEVIKIGFAPFAKHATKTLPVEKSEELIKKLTEKKYGVYLLGGKEEQKYFEEWTKKYEGVYSTLSLTLLQQTALLQQMNAVISMDSANMHLAAVQGVPVISIWGATHPCFGFSGIDTDSSTWISTPHQLPCRPCSVFGNKPCSNITSPLACLHEIDTDEIVTKTTALIHKIA
jgi:ADP-heptose:LPS heptosyltransferase